MKRIFLSAAFCCALFYLANAQTDRGTILLGGNATYQTFDGFGSFSATPNIGVFVLNDVVTGVGFSWYKQKDASSWALGPFIRLYLFGNDSGKFIVQSGFNIGGAKGTDTDFGFDAAFGYALFLNESIALEFLADYTKTGEDKGIFTLGAGFQLHFHR